MHTDVLCRERERRRERQRRDRERRKEEARRQEARRNLSVSETEKLLHRASREGVTLAVGVGSVRRGRGAVRTAVGPGEDGNGSVLVVRKVGESSPCLRS